MGIVIVTYVIYVPEENEPEGHELAFLDLIEPGASSHTLGMLYDAEGSLNGVRHYRLGTTIRRIV